MQRQTTAVNKVLDRGQEGLANLLSQRKGQREKDLFELPKLERDANEDSESDSEREDVLRQLDIDHKTDIHQVDLNRSEFQAMTASQKYEVLLELREKRKQNSWAKLGEMPREARSFSGFQMERLLKRRDIQKRMDDVGSEITEDQVAVADEKLFVGDKEGLRREKALMKAKIVGKDFVYMEGANTKQLTGKIIHTEVRT